MRYRTQDILGLTLVAMSAAQYALKSDAAVESALKPVDDVPADADIKGESEFMESVASNEKGKL